MLNPTNYLRLATEVTDAERAGGTSGQVGKDGTLDEAGMLHSNSEKPSPLTDHRGPALHDSCSAFQGRVSARKRRQEASAAHDQELFVGMDTEGDFWHACDVPEGPMWSPRATSRS